MKMRYAAIGVLIWTLMGTTILAQRRDESKKPNIVVIIVDQWRAQATGYAGDKNVLTPNIDRLAASSVNLKNAVSGMPVCTPFRGSLMTGQYPLTHGLFMNDVMLDTAALTVAEVLAEQRYQTGFIGKWHIDGHGRSTYIPEWRRQGFEYWKALECTHNYNHSAYYAGDSEVKRFWDGYDALAQCEDAGDFIAEASKDERPFALFISLGPPHNPYQTAPEKYRKIYEDRVIALNENVPASLREQVTKDLRGYYAHITAIDHGVGEIWQRIRDLGIEENTIIMFTADHGDLLGAHGSWDKQQPYAESIRVPFLIHYPALLGRTGSVSPLLINSPDIMPTLLGLADIKIPPTVEGIDYSAVLEGRKRNTTDHTLISCVQPFGQWQRKKGGREYRGIVTEQYTYVRDLEGPWLLFDDIKDPMQMNNLISRPEHAATRKRLDKILTRELKKRNDEFKPGMEYVRKWNYVVDETGTVPYRGVNFRGKPIDD